MAESDASAAPPAKPRPQTKKKSRTLPGTRPQHLPLFHVVLLDDDEHSYDYVVEMLQVVFGYPVEKGFKMAQEVDRTGRVIVQTTHKEAAELKRDQIHAYGADARIARCRGSMSAIIEPAEQP